MEKSKEFKQFKKDFNDILKGSVPINTAFKSNIAEAMFNYANKKGISVQDLVRLAVSSLLTKAGYLD